MTWKELKCYLSIYWERVDKIKVVICWFVNNKPTSTNNNGSSITTTTTNNNNYYPFYHGSRGIMFIQHVNNYQQDYVVSQIRSLQSKLTSHWETQISTILQIPVLKDTYASISSSSFSLFGGTFTESPFPITLMSHLR